MSGLPGPLLEAAGWLGFGLAAGLGLFGIAKGLGALGLRRAADPEPSGSDHD